MRPDNGVATHSVRRSDPTLFVPPGWRVWRLEDGRFEVRAPIACIARLWLARLARIFIS